MTLIDTSVWIEFFKSKPTVDSFALQHLIEERSIATCLPVKAELLSGQMSSEVRVIVSDAFDSMVFVDPDWSSQEVWNQLIDFAIQARHKKVGIPKIVDRMILLCAFQSGATLWTLDRKLQRLADHFGISQVHGH